MAFRRIIGLEHFRANFAVLLLALILTGYGQFLFAQDQSILAAPKFKHAPKGARITEEGWFAPLPLSQEKPKLQEEITDAVVIPIEGVITGTTYDSIKRKLYEARKAQLAIFEMDTPGGDSKAMEKIVQLILDDLKGTYTVAYVNPKAFSAGAIISLACNEIVLTPTGVIGDAMPIMIGPQGIVEIPEKERGKFESAARSQVRILAKRNGYSVELCEAMITISMELWLIRNPKTMELKIVDAKEWRGKVSRVPLTTQPTAQPAKIISADWEYVRIIDDPNELVTATSDEAIFLGLGTNIFESMEQLKKHYNITTEPKLLKDTWSERLVYILTSPALVGVLFFVGVLCAYMEIRTPGFGIPGAIAVACFAIIFGSRYLVGLATWWEIALFVLGLVLIIVEVFITPGFGVLGITGILCCVVALIAILIPNMPDKLPIPETELDWDIFSSGLFSLLLGAILAIIAAGIVSKYLPKLPIASRLVLAPAEEFHEEPVSDKSAMKKIQVGDVGIVEGMCRPVGRVRFGDKLLDASSEGGIIEVGSKVRVLRHEANHLVVEKVGNA